MPVSYLNIMFAINRLNIEEFTMVTQKIYGNPVNVSVNEYQTLLVELNSMAVIEECHV